MGEPNAFRDGNYTAVLMVRLLDGSQEQAIQHRLDLCRAIEADGRAAVIAASIADSDGPDDAMRFMFPDGGDDG